MTKHRLAHKRRAVFFCHFELIAFATIDSCICLCYNYFAYDIFDRKED